VFKLVAPFSKTILKRRKGKCILQHQDDENMSFHPSGCFQLQVHQANIAVNPTKHVEKETDLNLFTSNNKPNTLSQLPNNVFPKPQ
jgi:hypothetical protein